ncbi:sigma-54 interaction domain-containing protein [Clostridium sp. MT-14]|uniref:Sigma 54-interacting transcriptional regulator n=1 Tax=Clostridium aromativorans TaxID=2836848 RepID=A0ABS8N9L6_9CLOT|nr:MULTISPECIES: sigma 54-interacting transcriptional regulator [Clostridium]KAA8670819.1 PAS domain-containing protein [Clostridium sp. HV4-5-A1G]MCC9295745.1 sigma 54-interacting transcriptional regulator [Clostridium aromativorans]CAB1243463.1 PAS domain S-box [Clostridiaceae bacterium BL-3]
MKINVSRIMNTSILLIKLEGKLKNLSQNKETYDYVIVNDNRDEVKKIFCYLGEKHRVPFDTIGYLYYKDLIEVNQNVKDVIIVKDDKYNVVGIITNRELLNFIENKYKILLEDYTRVKTDLNAFMTCSDDLVCITDGSGIKVRISSSCEKIYGVKPKELIGKNVRELEKKRIYLPSATRMAIEEKKPITLTQRTKSGKKLLVVATPVFDKDNNVKRVVSISKDITNEEMLKSDLYKTKDLLQRYEQELAALRIEQTQDHNIIYRSKEMEKVIEVIKKVAVVDSTLIIYGETGVGKEVICKYVHNISNRNGRPFVKLNCGAIPENLLETELFGYEKGAFTGARSEGKPGLFEIADKGTLFLDEIGEIPFILQVKLLRVLQEKEFIRVGGIKPRKVDVRIIAATNRDLKKLVEDGKFRQDLYYRLNVIPITIPPLRDRVEDISVLAYHFLDVYNKKYGYSKQLTNEVIEVFMKYRWPGNVRELENVIERTVIISEDNQIRCSDLPGELTTTNEDSNLSDEIHISKLMPLRKASALVEYQLIKRAIDENGSTYKAAKVLDVDQSTIVRKIKKYESAAK